MWKKHKTFKIITETDRTLIELERELGFWIEHLSRSSIGCDMDATELQDDQIWRIELKTDNNNILKSEIIVPEFGGRLTN